MADLLLSACKYKGKQGQTDSKNCYKTLIYRLTLTIFPLPLPP